MTIAPRDSLARDPAADYPRQPLPLARSILWYPARRGSRDTGGRGAGYSVFVDQATLDHMRQHLEAAPEEARLGFLTGQLYTCSDIEVPYLVIDGVFQVKYPIEADDPMPLFRRVWERLSEEAGRNRIQLAGWYRSCPRGDVTLSRQDTAAHEDYFTDPWQVAILARVDRMRPGGGMYRMVPGTNWTTTPISFYEMLVSAPRSPAGGKRTRLTWKNYHTNELVLAADERGIRPQDADPRPTPPPARRTPTAEESRRPTLQVVRPVVPQSGARTTVRTEAVAEAPAAPRPTPVTTPRPVEGPDVVRVQPRRRRRLTTLASAAGLVAAAGLGLLLVLQGLNGPQVVEIDAQAARVVRLDRVTDTLGPALRNYSERAELFRDGFLACEGLTRGYAAVDTLWSAYRQVRRGLAVTLDDARQARDGRLTAQVDAMRREYARAGCTAP